MQKRASAGLAAPQVGQLTSDAITPRSLRAEGWLYSPTRLRAGEIGRVGGPWRAAPRPRSVGDAKAHERLWAGPTGERIGRLICDIYTPEGTPFVGCPRMTLKRVIGLAAANFFHPRFLTIDDLGMHEAVQFVNARLAFIESQLGKLGAID